MSERNSKKDLSFWNEVHNGMYGNESYRNQMDPTNGPRQVVKRLVDLLLAWSSVFEYGIGSWTNAIYLAKEGYLVEGQDASSNFIENCRRFSIEYGLDMPIHHSLAQEHLLSRDYDAFVCTFILHFMSEEEAMKVVRNMQAHTRPGWYNAIAAFTLESEPSRPDRFYPREKDFPGLYSGWEICDLESWSSNTADGKSTKTIGMIARKPE